MNMAKIVKCPICECHVVMTDDGKRDFCIKDENV